MRTLVAIGLFLALASGAQAYCFAPPDTAATHYGDNQLGRTICLQDELARSTNQNVEKQMLDQQLSKMQRDMQQQKFQLQQLQNQMALDRL